MASGSARTAAPRRTRAVGMSSRTWRKAQRLPGGDIQSARVGRAGDAVSAMAPSMAEGRRAPAPRRQGAAASAPDSAARLASSRCRAATCSGEHLVVEPPRDHLGERGVVAELARGGGLVRGPGVRAAARVVAQQLVDVRAEVGSLQEDGGVGAVGGALERLLALVGPGRAARPVGSSARNRHGIDEAGDRAAEAAADLLVARRRALHEVVQPRRAERRCRPRRPPPAAGHGGHVIEVGARAVARDRPFWCRRRRSAGRGGGGASWPARL